MWSKDRVQWHGHGLFSVCWSPLQELSPDMLHCHRYNFGTLQVLQQRWTVKLLHSSLPLQKQEYCATAKGARVLQRQPERGHISTWGVKALLWEARDFLHVWGSDLRYFIENKCLKASSWRAEQVWGQQQRPHNLMGKKTQQFIQLSVCTTD